MPHLPMPHGMGCRAFIDSFAIDDESGSGRCRIVASPVAHAIRRGKTGMPAFSEKSKSISLAILTVVIVVTEIELRSDDMCSDQLVAKIRNLQRHVLHPIVKSGKLHGIKYEHTVK